MTKTLGAQSNRMIAKPAARRYARVHCIYCARNTSARDSSRPTIRFVGFVKFDFGLGGRRVN